MSIPLVHTADRPLFLFCLELSYLEFYDPPDFPKLRFFTVIFVTSGSPRPTLLGVILNATVLADLSPRSLFEVLF